MSNFNEEQEFLKITASNLLLFAHQREQSNSLRNISMKIGVSQTNAEAVLQVIDILSLDGNNLSNKMEEQLKLAIQICQRERTLKGSESNEYFKSENQD